MSLVKKIYFLTSQLPNDERFGLISQINRSCISIPSNIAEGSGKTTNKDFKRFLDISIASSYELETQLILAEELFDVSSKELIENLNALQNIIGGFTRQIRSRIENNI